MTQIDQGTKETATRYLKVGVWNEILVEELHDWAVTSTGVHAMVYINYSGRMKKGAHAAMFDVQAVRKGTEDETAVQSFTVAADIDDTSTNRLFHAFNQPLWFGKNPDGFTWYIRPRVNIVSMTLSTRYPKAMSD